METDEQGVVKNVANPYPFEAVLSDSPEADRNREHMAFEQARVAILAALKAGADG